MRLEELRMSPVDPPSNVRILLADPHAPAEGSLEPAYEPLPRTCILGARWTVVDTNGATHGRLATRSEAVRLMSTLAGQIPAALPLHVADPDGHETGDRLA